MTDNCCIYCLSHANARRLEVMQRRFNLLQLRAYFFPGADARSDPRLASLELKGAAASCMWGHLDMMRWFLDHTTHDFGIFCEDDVYVHKMLKGSIPTLTAAMQTHELDVLLLGYLNCGYQTKLVGHIEVAGQSRRVMSFGDDVWGAQMYMLKRDYARSLLNKYTQDYLIRSLDEASRLVPFSADWTITKDGNRALIHPMLAVEDGEKFYDHEGQREFHRLAHELNFVPGDFC